MDRYTARINLYGDTERERIKNRLEYNLSNRLNDGLSYKQVKLNGVDTQLIINSGTVPYNKTFTSLPGQKILAGDYIEWVNQIWLVYEADCDDEIYIDGSLRQCQHKIYWQATDGRIISRYVWTQNASAYNNGEQGNNTITLQSNQFMVYIPYDEDTECLNNGKRVHISKSNIICKPYELTRPDDISYGYGEKGVLNIIFTQSQFNEQNDKLVTLEDGSQVWICDYHSPALSPEPSVPDETTDLSAVIAGGNTLRCRRAKSWNVTFIDQDGNEIIDQNFQWKVDSEYTVKQVIDGQRIQLKVDDEQLIDCSFLLSVSVDDIIVTKVEISIIDGL